MVIKYPNANSHGNDDNFRVHRRCLMSILSTFYCPEVVTEPKHKLSQSGTYFIPPKGNHYNAVLYELIWYPAMQYII